MTVVHAKIADDWKISQILRSQKFLTFFGLGQSEIFCLEAFGGTTAEGYLIDFMDLEDMNFATEILEVKPADRRRVVMGIRKSWRSSGFQNFSEIFPGRRDKSKSSRD